MTLVYKPIATHDLALVVDLEQRSHSHPWTLRNFEDALTAGYFALGLWQADALLAYAWVMRAVDEAELLDLTVSPSHRRMGFGCALLSEVEQRLRASACTALHLEVRASNAAARALYAQAGFADVGVRPGYYPSGHSREDAILMRKQLVEQASHGKG
jgi:[ribosomal protein S18]-alanine N-acetyltransferase